MENTFRVRKLDGTKLGFEELHSISEYVFRKK